jgi:hypothetical protein
MHLPSARRMNVSPGNCANYLSIQSVPASGASTSNLARGLPRAIGWFYPSLLDLGRVFTTGVHSMSVCWLTVAQERVIDSSSEHLLGCSSAML